MKAKRLVVAGGAGLVSVLTLLSLSHLLADKGAATPKTSPLAEAALETYKCASAEYLTGKTTVEDLYQWSRRLMECEVADGKATALADHAARMRQLHDKMDKLFKLGLPPATSFKYNATKFYVLEAEKALGEKPAQ
jgi:hypothetical protein